MEKPTPTKLPKLQQIRVTVATNGCTAPTYDSAGKPVYPREHDEYQASLVSMCPANLWPKESYRTACPCPILVRKHHQKQLSLLSAALTAALNDIVKRWWIDHDAQFFERMPLEPEEEDLLQWLDGQVSQGNLKQFYECQGSWRPDFLIEDPGDVENFLITEINARFSFNGFFHQAYGQEGLNSMNLREFDVVSAPTSTQMFDGLGTLFDRDVPLHLLKGQEPGMDIHMFIDSAERIFGITPRLIRPSDLRLEPDSQNEGKYRLCCLVDNSTKMFPQPSTFINDKGEEVEEIQQVGLELHQHELFSLPREMLRQVSLRCFNDLRSILLVHDKRMLGIVKQEVHQLIRRNVLTTDQGRALQNGIVDTFIPGSPELRSLVQKSISYPDLKDGYILKPIRSGKGAGILFGGDIGAHDWERTLSSLQYLEQCSISKGQAFVVQRRVNHSLYDLVLLASGEEVRYPLVGTWHIIHGKFCGLGIWRASGERICAISSGGAMICSVSKRYETRC
ncbi:hypothetical protein GGS21DRAFT_102151 [Xylaria nigripes]|nr:hypothetical protein GGS21DRAFT_102151 [Xylaria nigripes]